MRMKMEAVQIDEISAPKLSLQTSFFWCMYFFVRRAICSNNKNRNESFIKKKKNPENFPQKRTCLRTF